MAFMEHVAARGIPEYDSGIEFADGVKMSRWWHNVKHEGRCEKRPGVYGRLLEHEELATAYANVLCEFCAAASAEGGPTELRMLPISGGIFAGPFADEIATLTMDAIGAAAIKLPPEVRTGANPSMAQRHLSGSPRPTPRR